MNTQTICIKERPSFAMCAVLHYPSVFCLGCCAFIEISCPHVHCSIFLFSPLPISAGSENSFGTFNSVLSHSPLVPPCKLLQWRKKFERRSERAAQVFAPHMGSYEHVLRDLECLGASFVFLAFIMYLVPFLQPRLKTQQIVYLVEKYDDALLGRK